MDKIARHFDLELLNTLLVIAESGSLSAAAPKLCRSQSAVSEQVRKLEEMCGLPLLVRGKTGASLTPAGRRLVDHAREHIEKTYKRPLGDRLLRDHHAVRGRGRVGTADLRIEPAFGASDAEIAVRRQGRQREGDGEGDGQEGFEHVSFHGPN